MWLETSYNQQLKNLLINQFIWARLPIHNGPWFILYYVIHQSENVKDAFWLPNGARQYSNNFN